MQNIKLGFRETVAGMIALSAVALTGCSSSDSGVVAGPADAHCKGVTPQKTSQSVCHEMAKGGGGGDEVPDYGKTMYGSEGDDDDCKYHVTWSADDVEENQGVTFTAVITSLVDNKPVTGAQTYIESYLNTTHPADVSNNPSKEAPAGTYTIGPVTFDEAGNWTVRFHIYGQCTDVSPESPHGHAAFYVKVP